MTKNPLKEPLEGQTKFRIRVSMRLDVTVPDEPSEVNGQVTGLTRACDTVERELFRKFDFKEGPQGLEGYFSKNREYLKNLGIELVKEPGFRPLIEPEAPALNWWDTPEGPMFERILFHGCGDYSARDAAVLKKRFETALSIQGGIQQPGHPETEDGWEREQEGLRKCNQYIEDTVRDIATALLGREITFGKELPYP